MAQRSPTVAPQHNPERPAAFDATVPVPADAVVSAFQAMQNELLSTLLYVLGNREDALDAIQDAFVKCWRAKDKLDGVDNLRAWIFRVTLNTAKDLQRSAWKRKVKPMVLEELMLVTHDPLPGVQLEERETVARLRSAISQLRPDEQEVFLLRQNGELTYEEIADIRKTPIGTIKTQMRTALMKLRKVLAPDPDAEAL